MDKPQPRVTTSEPAAPVISPRLLWSVLLVILAFNVCLYKVGFGIGVGIFNLFAAIGVLIAIPPKKQTITAWTIAGVSIIAGLLVGVRANSFVQGFDLVVSQLALFFLLLLNSAPNLPQTVWGNMKAAFEFGLASLFGGFRILDAMGAESKHPTRERFNLFSLLKTALITVLILGVFVAILRGADPIFAQMIDTILRQSLGRIVWSLVVAFTAVSLLTITVAQPDDRELTLPFFSIQDFVVALGGLVGLFGVFLFVQGKYLFASHEVFQQFGITYSDYVRGGFTQLLVAAFFGSFLSYFMTLKQRATRNRVLMVIGGFLLVELALLLASAWRRDVMYIEIFGLTRMRIIGEVFLFWLVGVLGVLGAFAYRRSMGERWLLAGIGGLTVAALGYFNVVNMDMRIAEQAPKIHTMRDFFYVSNLSPDAAPAWEGMITSGEQLMKEVNAKESVKDEDRTRVANLKLALLSLQAERETLEKKFAPWPYVLDHYMNNLAAWDLARRTEPLAPERSWQAYTLSEYQAYLLVTSNHALYFDRAEALRQAIRSWQIRKGVNLYQEERRLMYDYEYPFVSLKLHYTPIDGLEASPSSTPR